MKPLLLHRHDSEKNMHRFYRMMLQPDLFGNFCIIREWGRIGQAGTVKEDAFRHEADALCFWEKKHREKRRKQYRE